jgi:hypothetical protein
VAARVFVTKPFARFARKEEIADGELCAAIRLAETKGPDADLGGGIIKQRVAREGKGKSGGYRTLIAYRNETRAIFIYGFAKSDLGNITAQELKALKKLAKILLAYDEQEIKQSLATGVLREVSCDGKTISK